MDGNRLQRPAAEAASETATATGAAAAAPGATTHPLAPRAERIAAEQPQARYQRVLAERDAMGAQLTQRLAVMRKPLEGSGGRALAAPAITARPSAGATIFRAKAGGYKRGDHVFNHGLGKAFGDLAVAAGMNHSSGAPALKAALDAMRASVSGAAFELTVDKGAAPAGGDANSQQFGRALALAVGAFNHFLATLEEAETATGAEAAKAHADLAQAEARANQAFTATLATAFDPASAALLDANARKLVPQAKATLTQLPVMFAAALDAAAKAAKPTPAHAAGGKTPHK